jgi:hypothetical protein
VGPTVGAAGFLVVLFKSLQGIQAIYQRDWITELGGLRVVYDDHTLKASADTVISWEVGAEANPRLENITCSSALQVAPGRRLGWDW